MSQAKIKGTRTSTLKLAGMIQPDDATVDTADSTDVESVGDYTSPRDVSSIHITNLRQEQGHTTTLDVDQFSGSLLNDLGVNCWNDWVDPFQGSGRLSGFRIWGSHGPAVECRSHHQAEGRLYRC